MKPLRWLRHLWPGHLWRPVPPDDPDREAMARRQQAVRHGEDQLRQQQADLEARLQARMRRLGIARDYMARSDH